MPCHSRPLFWLKYCFKGFYQTLKISMILYVYDFVILGSSFHCNSVRAFRSQGESREVVPNPNPRYYIPGFCHRLHCRGTVPPRGESSEREIHLQESHFITNNACSPDGKSTGYSRVLSPSNLVSSSSLQTPTDPTDPGYEPKGAEFRCTS